MENMVFAAGVNSMRIEPVENISVDVPKEHFTDYDENVGVKCNMSSKLEHTDSVINVNYIKSKVEFYCLTFYSNPPGFLFLIY